MNKKKIALFIVSLYGGGAERVVSILLNHFEDSFDIHLVLLQPIIEYDIPASQKITVLDKSPSNNSFFNILKIPFLAFRYYRFLRKNNITTSFSFLNRPNFIAGFLKIFGWKGKVVMSERTFTSEYYTTKSTGERIGRWLVKKLYPKADLIICNSKCIEKDLREIFKVQTTYSIIYNPINLTQINESITYNKKFENNTTRPFTFITIGRLNQIKNHKLFIEAASLLTDFDFRVQIVGKGELKKILEDYIILTNMQERITLIDHSSDPIKYLIMADCFVLTSNFEGFPNVLLEALACNLPIISTDCKGGVRELLAPSISTDTLAANNEIIYVDYGLLVPVGNAEILAEAMRSMYNNTVLQQKYRAKNYNRAKDFDTSVIMDSFKNLLNQ